MSTHMPRPCQRQDDSHLDLDPHQAMPRHFDHNHDHHATSTATTSTVHNLLASTKDPGTIVDSLYLATLGRYAIAAERNAAIAYLGSGDLTKKTEDLQYSLLNRLEYLFN